jgi:hypothetical protein
VQLENKTFIIFYIIYNKYYIYIYIERERERDRDRDRETERNRDRERVEQGLFGVLVHKIIPSVGCRTRVVGNISQSMADGLST